MAPTLSEDGAKPGDLIEIFRGQYQHWAVYIGGNEVVHLTTPNTDCDSCSSGNMLMALESCIAQVKRDKIWDVVCDDRFEINNLLDDKYEPRDRHVIVREACRMVDLEMKYSAFTWNCEHFVTVLRYGRPESRQVKNAVDVGAAVIVGVGIVAVGATLLAAFFNNDDSKKKQNKRYRRHK
ncbi:phospholipase A and acyltransferase 4-like [Cyclopterus lumpus]|uniref:Retinoic acid receptor responder 3 n=1 Tax=Cyclopterus lumpus TaxID=8103 RepID=A0A8C2ZKJ0_CYCLU|nr:phospholipase A and acyltransferase 4-like [Cyclopterus lumpus]